MATHFQLHLITERLSQPAWWLPRVVAATAGGVDAVQLRDKGASPLDLHRHALDLRTALAMQPPANQPRLLVNDRLDVALALNADGVHLAGQSLPVAEAVRVASGALLVGRSVHALDEAIDAERAGADYVTFGHVFPSTSKVDLPPRGTQQLAEIVRALSIPVLAIGGVGLENLDAVLATGCAGVAVISAILAAPDPRQAARDLRQALDVSPHAPRVPFPLEPRLAQPAHHAARLA